MKYLFGCEIECYVDVVDFDFGRDATYTDDGSIQPPEDTESIEVRTRPFKYGELEPLITRICKKLQEANADTNSSCGLHVHVSHPQFFKRDTLKKIVHTWVAIEDVMFSMQPASRFNNEYTQRLVKLYADRSLDELPKTKGEILEKFNYLNRYWALNLAALGKHGTIECRLHSGTVNPQKIIHWVRLLYHFYRYCLDNYNMELTQTLLTTTLTADKIKDTFELLELPKDTSEYLMKRIRKQTFKRLGKQNQMANEIYTLNKALEDTKRTMEADRKKIMKIGRAFARTQQNRIRRGGSSNLRPRTRQESEFYRALYREIQARLLSEQVQRQATTGELTEDIEIGVLTIRERCVTHTETRLREAQRLVQTRDRAYSTVLNQPLTTHDQLNAAEETLRSAIETRNALRDQFEEARYFLGRARRLAARRQGISRAMDEVQPYVYFNSVEWSGDVLNVPSLRRTIPGTDTERDQ